MNPALHQIIVIFFALAVGYLCRKAGVITEEGTSTLSNIVVKVILPFYLFGAIADSSVSVDSKTVITAICLSAGMFIFSAVIALVFVSFVRPKHDERGVFLFETVFGNVTYIGIPVCAAIIGGDALFYASLLNIPYNLLCLSLGVFLLAGQLPLKKILNPAFIGGLLGAICYIMHIKVPSVITDACSFIGQATSPCAMLVVGSVLGSVAVRDVFSDWRAIPYVVIRLFGIGAVIALLLKHIDVPFALKGVLVLMASMPAATNSTMLCTIYGGNRELSAKLIFLSTALSVVSVPVWASLLEKVL